MIGILLSLISVFEIIRLLRRSLLKLGNSTAINLGVGWENSLVYVTAPSFVLHCATLCYIVLYSSCSLLAIGEYCAYYDYST